MHSTRHLPRKWPAGHRTVGSSSRARGGTGIHCCEHFWNLQLPWESGVWWDSGAGSPGGIALRARPQPPQVLPPEPQGGWGQAGFAGAAPRSALETKMFTAVDRDPRAEGEKAGELDRNPAANRIRRRTISRVNTERRRRDGHGWGRPHRAIQSLLVMAFLRPPVPSRARCRVEVWRGGLGRSLFSPVGPPFRLRVSHHLDHAPFPHPAHRTVRADFPHTALGQNASLLRLTSGLRREACGASPVPGPGTGDGSGIVCSPAFAPCASRIAIDGVVPPRGSSPLDRRGPLSHG